MCHVILIVANDAQKFYENLPTMRRVFSPKAFHVSDVTRTVPISLQNLHST